MSNKCRTCGEITRPLYAQNLYDDQKKLLLQQIEVITGLWLDCNDKMPNAICAYCVQDLKQAVGFRERCINVQIKLHRQSKNEFELMKTISKLRGRDRSRQLSKNDCTANIIKQNGFCESNLQIIGIETESNAKDFASNLRQDSLREHEQYAKTEDYQKDHDSLMEENTNESEKSEDTDMDYETYSELMASTFEEIEDRSDIEDEYDRSLDDWAGNIFKHEDDNKLHVEPGMGELEGSLGLSEEIKIFDINHSMKNSSPPGKIKRKYTFITRKPAATGKRKYKPTRSEYVCEICGKSYTKLFSFSEHKLQHTGVKGFKCTECPKEFFTKRLLKQHVIKHTDERPFVCRICSLTFRSRAHRNDHEKKHINPQPWPCGICGKKLTTSYARDLHEAAHRGVRKHHCDTCDRGFITRKHLMSHKQTKLHKQNLEREKEEFLE